jgi:hypothetical protein
MEESKEYVIEMRIENCELKIVIACSLTMRRSPPGRPVRTGEE